MHVTEMAVSLIERIADIEQKAELNQEPLKRLPNDTTPAAWYKK